MKKVCALAFFLTFLCASAQAGNLFPPNNIGADPSAACPNGTVLKWNGDGVDCADPTPGVTVTCPAGQILIGINRGAPVCKDHPPTIIGSVESLWSEKTAAFGYCRLAWGVASCDWAGNITCSKGYAAVTALGHDDLSEGEDMSPGKYLHNDGAHVTHVSCIY